VHLPHDTNSWLSPLSEHVTKYWSSTSETSAPHERQQWTQNLWWPGLDPSRDVLTTKVPVLAGATLWTKAKGSQEAANQQLASYGASAAAAAAGALPEITSMTACAKDECATGEIKCLTQSCTVLQNLTVGS
jgi:hypothetical protein